MSHFSFTRSAYDQCALKKKIQESTQPFMYMTDTTVTESKDACFVDPSPFQQNQFRSIPNGQIDIESDLRGQTRNLSKCPEHKYNPEKSIRHENKLKQCRDEKLVPEYTRVNRPCNVLSGITINRFHPLCEDVQSTTKIHSNSYIGFNTRLQYQDLYKAKRESESESQKKIDIDKLLDANGREYTLPSRIK